MYCVLPKSLHVQNMEMDEKFKSILKYLAGVFYIHNVDIE